MKRLVLIFVFIISLFLVQIVSAGVRINEVMANTPENTYGGSDCEWIELYNNAEVNMTNWTIDTNGQSHEFSFYLKDFLIITGNKSCFLDNWNVEESKIIEWTNIGLVNTGDNVTLLDNESVIIQNFDYDDSHPEESWQFCSNDWIENPPTPGSENDCEEDENPDPVDNNEDTYIELEWDEEDIVNGEEFQIKVKAYYLDNEIYDVKVWIEDDDEVVISETYDENDEWVVSSQYYNEFFDDPDENESKKIKLRIKTKYDNFKGDAKILAKLRLNEDGDIVDDFDEDIEILEKEEDVVDNKDDSKDDDKDTSTKLISLGNKDNVSKTEDIKTKNNIVYESKQELIKKYAIYGFALFCVLLCILLAFEKLK